MRIGLVIYGSLETISGGFLYDRKLVEFLRQQGDQVEIISIPWRNYLSHLTDTFSEDLFMRIMNLQVDILLQDELNHPSLFLLNSRLQKHISFPLVSIVHHLRSSELRPAWQNQFYRVIEKLYLSKIDAFIFNSQTTKQSVYRAGIELRDKPWVIAYPAGNRFAPLPDLQAIEARALKPGPLQIIFLGNLIPRKGLHILLEALRHIPTSLCRLKIVGSLKTDPGYAQKMKQYVVQSELAEQVEFLDTLNDQQLAQILAAGDLLATPSSYEGFGIVYLEGMSFGLPAIATSAGAAGEIISHNHNGFLVTPGNSAALAERLSNLAQDRQKLAAFSLAARQRFDEHPTWEMTGAQI